MAANRFATLIHRKTNRITLVLVYAFLEWSLIFFILLNSLFSYFILRFADYFGLKRPCLLCSRLDRFFGDSPSHKDLFCDDHALQISSKPLLESKGSIEISKPPLESKGSLEASLSFDEDLISSSCCPFIETDLGDKGCSFTTNLIGDDVQVHNGRLFNSRSRSIFLGSVHLVGEETEDKVVEQKKEEDDVLVDEDDEFSCYVSSFDCNKEVVVTTEKVVVKEGEDENRVDLAMEVDEAAPVTNLEFYIDDQDCHLIPVVEFYKPSEEVREISDSNGDFILDFGAEPDFTAVVVTTEEDVCLLSDEVSVLPLVDESKQDEAETKEVSPTDGELLQIKNDEETKAEVSIDREIPHHELIGELLNFGAEPDFAAEATVTAAVESVRLSSDEVSMFPSPGESKHDEAETKQGSPTGYELLQIQNDEETKAEVSIDTEIPHHELIGDLLNFDAEPDFAAVVTAEEEDVRLSSDETSTLPSPGESKQDEAETKQDSPTEDELVRTQSDEETDAEVSIGTEIPDHEQIGDIQSHQLIPQDDDHDNDHGNDTLEFRTVDIETRRPVLKTNEEHNAMFQPEGPEHTLDSVAKLKTELEEERKALNALYEELEEERSASATAANETMAMINRLHEEKAAMQMEALQYQRMMEEQSEFDQEALQLLNELIVKREKENAELEKEIEVCRKRLEEYEAKEKMGMMMKRMRDSSFDSMENNGELQHKNGEESEMENTPVDVVLRLDECLDDYEGERLSILGRLKFLEEKLTALNDEEEAETFESNGNGHTNGKQHRVLKSKRLLPLFDAVDGEMENGNHYENGVDESEKGEIVTVEEEVDDLYERLEALEADREFLRHCVGSLKKGDKGVHLLHEILQHLRDLKNIDLIRVRENEDMTF